MWERSSEGRRSILDDGFGFNGLSEVLIAETEGRRD